MGKKNHIFPHAVIGEAPQDLKYAGEYSTVVIGDGNDIHEFATIHRATGENCETRIGSHNMLQAYTHVATTATSAITSSYPASPALPATSLSKTMLSSAP